jgi:glucoamylase
LTVTSPANGGSVDTATVSVTGTAAPGAKIVAESAGGTGTAGIASAQTRSGHWSLSLPTAGFGTTVITVTATRDHSTGYSQLVVNNVALPGTTVLNTQDPTGDDNGPGTYAYPTDPVFVPGEFDLTNMQVSQDMTNVYIQFKIAKLVNTFGSDFGAQLLDLYVRNPASTSTPLTSAAAASRNYTIAPADAWTERLEIQGFASPIWVGAPPGASPQVVVNDPTGTVTLILPQSEFGTVVPGWVFTVALTGQDGFGTDQARNFTATPGDFTFGVCAVGRSSPICSVEPGTVAKVMDTIPPSDVSQATELDPTLGPVVLHGVTVPTP